MMPLYAAAPNLNLEDQQREAAEYLLTAGRTAALPSQTGAKFEVFQPREIALAKSVKVRVTKNSYDESRKLLSNGQIYHICSIYKGVNIQLRNTVSGAVHSVYNLRFGHMAPAHCISSQASQGKTVDEIYIAQPSATFGAANAKQFYVSVSRGREKVQVYMDDKEALLANVSKSGDRHSALELVSKPKHIDYVPIWKKTAKPQASFERRLVINIL